jgi:hypothetical protein
MHYISLCLSVLLWVHVCVCLCACVHVGGCTWVCACMGVCVLYIQTVEELLYMPGCDFESHEDDNRMHEQ